MKVYASLYLFLSPADSRRDSFSEESIIQGSQITHTAQDRITQKRARPTVLLNVPEEMRASIASYRNRFNKYLRATSTHEKGEFDPWGLVNR